MPFNASGIYKRLFSWRDDRDAGIKIRADRMDQEMDGLAEAVNLVLEGQVNFRGPLKNVFGTAAAPAFTFFGDTDTGVYRAAPNKIAISAGGVEQLSVHSSGAEVKGKLTAKNAEITETAKAKNIEVTGKISLPNGTEAVPTFKFTTDPDSGFYLSAANSLAVSLGGNKAVEFLPDKTMRVNDKQVPTIYPMNATLPTSNIGPIWSEKYNSWMTWQVFNQNGANYAGYASVDIGQVFASSQPTARQGYVGFGVNISKSTHPAIYHRAKHLGQLKAPSQWQPKTIAYRENADGTITVPDLRGMHERFMDAGAGVNPNRVFGSYEEDMFKKHQHYQSGIVFFVTESNPQMMHHVRQYQSTSTQPGSWGWITSDRSRTEETGGIENRVKTTAFFGEIKL